MNETVIDLQCLVTFITVAEHNSFSKAATKLGVGKGTISRTITQLEAQLGVELLHRTTRHVSLSTAGIALYERTHPHLIALQKAITDLPERDEEPSGLLRMTAPYDFGSVVLPPIIASFSRRFPLIRFDIRLTGENIDLVKEGYDLAIRVATGPIKDSSLSIRRLGHTHAGFYASPTYLARKGRPRELEDERHTWIFHPALVRILKLKPEGIRYLVDDFLMAQDLIQEGMGIGLLPVFMVKNGLRDGLIEEITLNSVPPMTGDLILLYPTSGQIPKKLTIFRDFLVDSLRNHLG